MEPGFCRGRHIKRKGGQTKTLHHPNFNWLHPNFNWGQTKTLHHPNFKLLVNWDGNLYVISACLLCSFKKFCLTLMRTFCVAWPFLGLCCVCVCMSVCVWVSECRWCDFYRLCHLTGVLRWRREGSPAQRASSMWTCGRWTTPPSTSWSSRPSSPAPWTTADTCTGEWVVALVMTPGHLVLSDW